MKQLLCLLLVSICIAGCLGVAAAEVDSDSAYCFTQEDFSNEKQLNGICITGLPDATAGTVMLGTRVICVGDILTTEQVEKMTFVPLNTENDAQATITYLPIFETFPCFPENTKALVRWKKYRPLLLLQICPHKDP